MSRDAANADAGHVAQHLLDRYAAGATPAAAEDAWWAVEAHLERCATCRARLAGAVARSSPATAALVAGVERRVMAEIERLPPGELPAGSRRRLPARVRRWAAPALLPRVGMTVLVVLVALALDLADETASGRLPSLVLLLAPVAPLLGVAAAWSRGLDPAYELVVSSPRAGLDLVLWRTLAVLAVVVPVLAAAGWLAGESPALWLLPCLAFTAGALVLGEVVGLHRAANGLALAWVLVVAGPSLLTARPPAVLDPAASPAWAVATALAVVVLVARGRAYTRWESGR
jgi:hypothetical protein